MGGGKYTFVIRCVSQVRTTFDVSDVSVVGFGVGTLTSDH